MKDKVRILVVVADGTEDIEATVVIDLLRRANFEVTVAGTSEVVAFARGLKVLPDILLEEVPENANFDLIYVPGGAKGVENLSQNAHLEKILKEAKSHSRWISAICAAPLLLHKFEILQDNDKITSHPSVRHYLEKYHYTEEMVVVSGKIITSRGAGTSIPFALKIIELLAGKELSDKIATDIVYKS
ncbi:MAG: DJ-1 family glyoxalase III [Candidatus Kapaibacteriota bacterium]